jgi:hypothetical protein
LLFGGLSGGNNGSIISQSASGTNSRAITASMQPGDQLAPCTIHRHQYSKL